jgi:hypothetical protein
MNKSEFLFILNLEKQRIKEEKEKEDYASERDHQLRLAANEEAKVNNLVDNSLYIQLNNNQINSLCVTYCVIGEGSEY